MDLSSELDTELTIWWRNDFSFPVATGGTVAKNPMGPKSIVPIFPIEHNTKMNGFKTADRTTFDLKRDT